MSFWSHEDELLCEHFTDEQSTSRKLKYRTTLLTSSSSLNTPHLATTSEGTNGLTMEAMVGKLLDSVSWDTSHLATSRQS